MIHMKTMAHAHCMHTNECMSVAALRFITCNAKHLHGLAHINSERASSGRYPERLERRMPAAKATSYAGPSQAHTRACTRTSR